MVLVQRQEEIGRQIVASGSRTKNRAGKAEQARRTRRRITTAATDLFLADGFLTTTMAAIAARAGVTPATLYLSFGSKTAILHAAFDAALVGDDEPVSIMDRPWMREVLAQADGPAALASFVDHSAEVIQRASPLYQVIRAAAADPEVAELLERNKAERRAGFHAVIEALSRTDGFTTTMSVPEAAGVLYAVQSEETYALLVGEHQWSTQQWRAWVLRTMLAELFPDHRPARS